MKFTLFRRERINDSIVTSTSIEWINALIFVMRIDPNILSKGVDPIPNSSLVIPW